MSQQRFVAIGLQFLGVYALILTSTYVQYIVQLLPGFTVEPLVSVLSFLLALTPIALGVLLILCADWFAGWLGYGPEPVGIDARRSPRSRDFQAIGFSLVGALVLVRAAAQFAGLLSNILIVFRPGGIGEKMTHIATSFAFNGLSLVLQFALGIGLFFGGRRLADWWHDRYAPPEEPETAVE